MKNNQSENQKERLEEKFLENRLKQEGMKIVTTSYYESNAVARLVEIYEKVRLFSPSTWANKLASLLNERSDYSPFIGRENFITDIDTNCPRRYHEKIDKIMEEYSKRYGKRVKLVLK